MDTKTNEPRNKHFEALMARAEEDLDWPALDRLAKAFENAGSERKYLDARKWLERKLDAALTLRLDQGPPMNILDLGTGGGHFPYVARFFGHRVWALDLPGLPLYDALCAWIAVEKRGFRIEAQQPLPDLGMRFDLVTAFMIGFNTKRDGTLFTVGDWDWFLNDVRNNQLKADGHLLLKMIRQADRKGPKYGDPDLMELFASRGGRFQEKGRYAFFEPLL